MLLYDFKRDKKYEIFFNFKTDTEMYSESF